jgi:putative alpha-1,2-mannosidase
LPEGNTFTIKAVNVSDEHRYIQSATLNGKDFNRTTISHSEIIDGGELIFQMGREPNKNWGLK